MRPNEVTGYWTQTEGDHLRVYLRGDNGQRGQLGTVNDEQQAARTVAYFTGRLDVDNYCGCCGHTYPMTNGGILPAAMRSEVQLEIA